MSTRIPSSLKWLIDKRVRFDGELKKAQTAIAVVQRLILELSTIQRDIEAINRALEMHEIPVIPQNIKTITSCAKRNRPPSGKLTRTLLLGLRLREGEPLSTGALTLFVAERFASEYESIEDLAQLRLSVRYRLKNLAANNVIAPGVLIKVLQSHPEKGIALTEIGWSAFLSWMTESLHDVQRQPDIYKSQSIWRKLSDCPSRSYRLPISTKPDKTFTMSGICQRSW